MIFEDTFRDLLISFNLVDRRVFLIRGPQKPAAQMRIPYVIFFHVGPSPLHGIRGPLNVLDRTYQISIFDESQSKALAIADALRIRLDGFKGGYGGVCFGGIFYRAQTFSYEADTRLFQIITEFRVVFRFMDTVTHHKPTAVTTAVITGA